MTKKTTAASQLGGTRRQAEFCGPDSLGTEELLALVLGSGGNGLPPLSFSRHLLETTGGLPGLAHLRPGSLAERPGMGPSRSARLLAALELGRRLERERKAPPAGLPLSAQRVADWAIPRLGALEHEEVWVLCVDGRTTLRSTTQVGRGGVHGCGLLPRDLLTPVIREAAAGFVLVHNHPSGDPSPSSEDIELTHQLEHAAQALGTPLLDHVIVSRATYRSLFDSGLLQAA